MKVLIINKYLYPKGGDALVAMRTGELLTSRGHEVFYWGMKDGKILSYPNRDIFVDEVDLDSPIGVVKKFRIAMNILFSLEAISKIEKLIMRIDKPDIVHLHNFAHQISPSILYVFKKYKIPCVMTMHDYKLVCASYMMLSQDKICEACKGGKYYNCFLKGCVKNSKAKSLLNTIEMYLHHKLLHIYDLIGIFIAPSRFIKSKMEFMGFKGRIICLPNFINTKEYLPLYDLPNKYIIYYGRLSKEKGLFTLVKAMEGLGVKLKIVGDGPIADSLKNSVKKRQIDNIEFVGYKTGEELKKEIINSEIVIVPSEWYENNPLSIIEAFAFGKPVIGSRIGGIPELVKDNETGLTFNPGDPDDLRNKITELIKSPEKILIMGKNARKYVEDENNPDKYYNELMQIYNSVINKYGRD